MRISQVDDIFIDDELDPYEEMLSILMSEIQKQIQNDGKTEENEIL